MLVVAHDCEKSETKNGRVDGTNCKIVGIFGYFQGVFSVGMGLLESSVFGGFYSVSFFVGDQSD